ncbi:hypothetical protein [Kosmotoga pacifica]|nr:hypothetical protein [Kosmotoga pacifica]
MEELRSLRENSERYIEILEIIATRIDNQSGIKAAVEFKKYNYR